MSSGGRSNVSIGRSTHEVGDDFATLNLDRPMKRELKTAEQIQKHSLDGYLESRVIERALHLLSTGEEIQKLSVVKSIPNLLLEDSTGCLQRVIPRMQQTLPHGSTEYNMAACSTVQTIAQKNLISPENFTKSFLQHILNSIESKDVVAADAWLSTLIDVIYCLPPNVLQTEVFPVFAGKAHISKPVRVRVVSSRVLARLADLLPTPVVIKDVLPIIISLCQDVTGEVRASMCRELPNVPQLLNQESNKYLFNSIVDLANDEDGSVREAALHCISELIQHIPAASIKSTIIPLAKKLFSAAIESEDRSIVEVAHLYGVYCVRLKGFLSLSDKTWFLSRYVHLSQLNTTMRRKPDRFRLVTSSEEEELNQRLTQCRLQCAYNFPAMVAFSADLKSEYSEQLLVVLQNLTGDSFCLVRRCIASGFHELFKLQPKWISMLRVEFIKLLKDDNEKVLEGLVPQIGTILTICTRPHQGPDKMDWKDVAQALLTCERMLFESLTWRLHSQLLNQLEVVPKCFPAEFVNQHFVPLLMQRCDSTRTLPCRMAAIKIILIIMSDDSQSKQKQKMRNKLLELCNSYNFYSRMTFVRAITLLLDISPRVLKEMFYLNIIAMTEDKIPNIRIAVCKIIPKLKEIAFEPYDRKLIAAIESSVRRFTNEEDRDVQAQIKIMHAELDAVDTANKTVKRDYDATILEATSYASFGQTSSLNKTKLLLGTSDKTMNVYSPTLMPRSGQLAHHTFTSNRYNPTASSSLPITPIRRGTKPTVPANRPVARRK